MASGGGGAVPAFALGLSTTGLLEPTRVSEEHQVDPGKDPKGGEVRSVLHVQGDHGRGGLTLSSIDFDFVSSSVCPILLGQLKIGQRWHCKWAK